MKWPVPFWPAARIILGIVFLAGCSTMPEGIQQAKVAAANRIATEAPGDYFVGRRYYKPDFKFWAMCAGPASPGTAQLVMLNEKQKLAPDRQALSFGSDNNYEYKLYGFFSGERVYEPASNTIYPEFVLKNYELLSTTPPPIFRSQVSGSAETATTRLTIEKPEF